jgi:hypothetical protein
MTNTELRRQLRKVHRLKARAEGAANRLQKTIEREELRIGRAAIADDLATNRQKQEERSARTKRLIALGGLVDVAGLLDLHEDILLGALTGASQHCADEKWAERWRAAGIEKLRTHGSIRLSNPPETSKDRTSEEVLRARKVATRNLIVAGGIVDKAGLAAAPSEVLVGILKAISDHRSDTARLERWRVAGEAIRSKALVGVSVEFPGPITITLGQSLRQLGLRFDRKNLVWLGLAEPTSVSRLAKSTNGTISVDPRNTAKSGKRRRQEKLRGGGARPKRERQHIK